MLCACVRDQYTVCDPESINWPRSITRFKQCKYFLKINAKLYYWQTKLFGMHAASVCEILIWRQLINWLRSITDI